MSLLKGAMLGVWKCLTAFLPKEERLWIIEGGDRLSFWDYFQTIAWTFAKKRRRLTSAS